MWASSVFKKKWLIRFASLVLVCAFPFFFLGGPTPESTQLFGTIWDCGHYLFFMVLVFFIGFKFNLSDWKIILAITLFVFIVGGLIEVVQAHTGRDGNWRDLLRDLSGTWLAIFWLQASSPWVWCGRILAVLLVLPDAGRVGLEAYLKYYNDAQFPMIADAESPLAVYGYASNVERSAEWASQANHSLKIHLNTDRYSGITFRRLVRQWRGYTHLSFDIYNPDAQEMDMVIRVNDSVHEMTGWKYADRFNQKIHLSSGINHFSFKLADIEKSPVARTMDLSRISCVVIFAKELPQARDIFLDNVRLE